MAIGTFVVEQYISVRKWVREWGNLLPWYIESGGNFHQFFFRQLQRLKNIYTGHHVMNLILPLVKSEFLFAGRKVVNKIELFANGQVT